MSFLVNFWLGLGNPCHIATKTPLEKLNKNLGLADPHPPQLGQKTKFFDRCYLRAPLIQNNGKPDQIAPEGVKIHRHEICQTFYTSRLLTKIFLVGYLDTYMF